MLLSRSCCLVKKPRHSQWEAAPASSGCRRAAASAAAARMQKSVCSVTGTLPCSKRRELLCPREYLLCFLLYEVTGPKPHSQFCKREEEALLHGAACLFVRQGFPVLTYFLLYFPYFECCLFALTDLTLLAGAL